MEAATTHLETSEDLGTSLPPEFLENADQHVMLADSLSAQDSQQDAKLEYVAALAIDPAHAGALYGLANKLALEKNYEDAVVLYEEALEVRPNHLPSIRNLGSLQALQGRQEEASALFRKCLEIDPDHFGCNRQLGQLFLQQQRPAEAIVHFRTALKSRPELGVLHGQLAIALAAEADFEAAWTHVKEAERLGASLPPRFLVELRRLSPEPGKQ
jgi:tetratricopeptide (TPR) repeat protein